jgi:hypothetical protein
MFIPLLAGASSRRLKTAMDQIDAAATSKPPPQLILIKLCGNDERNLMVLELIESKAKSVKVTAEKRADADIGLGSNASPIEFLTIEIIDHDQVMPGQRFARFRRGPCESAKQLVQRIETDIETLLCGPVREIDRQARFSTSRRPN